MRLASETSNDPRDGVFLPKEAAHMLGATTYEQVLKDNNFFLNNLATIPINLEHAAWFAVIEPNQQSETKPVSLHEHLLCQSWFLHLESAGYNKCLLITNQSNLPEAFTWINENLQWLICKSILPGIDLPESSLLCRLNKLMNTATCQTYTDIFKKQFSLVSTNTDTSMANATTQPLRKWQATILSYDSDNSAEYPPLAVNHAANPSNNNITITVMQKDNNSALMSIKNKLNQLKEVITMAITQIKDAIAALLDAKCTTMPHYTTTNANQIMDHAPEDITLTQLNLQSFITDLKHELAMVFMETCTVLQQQSPETLTFNHPPSKT